MRAQRAAKIAALLLVFFIALTGSMHRAMSHPGGSNPDHLSLVISPPKSGTITSTPFSSSQADDCGSTHGIDYCHHHVLAGADWSFDVSANAGDPVMFNVHQGFADLYVVGYVHSVTPNCDPRAPRGHNIVIEVWAWDYARSVWRKLGLHNLAHVKPWVTPGSWVAVGQTVGTAEAYSLYPGCWEGVHVHGDYYNYEHYAAWTSKAWRGARVSASVSEWWRNDVLGVFGGTYGTGPDGHGGTWTGY